MPQAPKTVATPEQVLSELTEKKIAPQPKLKKNKHKGINKNIELTTETKTIEQIWPKDLFKV